MNCLHCGKPLTEEEINTGWHKHCIRSFFGTNQIPEIELTEEALKDYVDKSVFKGLTVPGVQRKMSLHLSRQGTPRLTMIDYPTGYIFKPQMPGYLCLPEAEDLAMRLAERAGIRTVPHALIKTNNQYAYITKRIDRIITEKKTVTVQKFAMEDFCQLDGRLTSDKYHGSYERCAKIISRYSVQKGLDLSELFLRLVVSFVTGNSDMHLKNFSLIETKPESGAYILSAAYALLPVNIVLPEDQEEFALTMNEKKTNLHRNDFLRFSRTIGLPENSVEKMLDFICSLQSDFLSICDDSYLPEEMKKSVKDLIIQRCQRITKHHPA